MRRVPSGTWERRVWASDKYGERSTVGAVAVVRPGPGALNTVDPDATECAAVYPFLSLKRARDTC